MRGRLDTNHYNQVQDPHVHFDHARLQRILLRLKSRRFDYSGLRAAQSADAAVAWGRAQQHLQLFNRNALRARVVQALFDAAGCRIFIETGTFHAATTIGARLYLGSPVVSCENSPVEYWVSRLMTLGMSGITLRRQDSPAFLARVVGELAGSRQVPFFYLDAHEGALDAASLPLVAEIRPLLALDEFVVLVDDVRVPGNDDFLWGTYGTTTLDIDLMAPTLRDAKFKHCYFPSYPAASETGLPSGYCLFWRSRALDAAVRSGQFPFTLLRPWQLDAGAYLPAA